MRLGRITAGIIAAGFGGVAAVVVGRAAADLDHSVNTKLMAGAFLGVAYALLWLGDRYGIIADAYTRSVVDLYARDEEDKTPVSPGRKPPRPPTT